MDPLWTPAQVSEFLQVPEATLHAWRYKDEGLPALKVGKHLRWREEDVMRWLEEQK